MNLKKIISNTRGEATSLVILVSMIVITLGVLTGTRLLEKRVQTSSRASNDYDFSVTLPVANSAHYLPLQLEYRAQISGSLAASTAYVDLKLYKAPINTNVPLISHRTSSFTNSNGIYYASGVLSSSSVIQIGDYILQVIPYGATGTIIGEAAQVPISVINPPNSSITPSITQQPSITETPTISPTTSLTATPIVTSTISPTTPASLTCVSLLPETTNSQFKLVLVASGAPNPFYVILQKDGSTIVQTVTDNATTITFPIDNPTSGKYKAFVSATQNGFYKSSAGCEYIYLNTTITVVPTVSSTPSATILPTITSAISPTISLTPTLTLIPTSTASISPTLNPSISPTKTPVNCPKKYIGDADCKQDKNNKSVTILDYAIWYTEFIKGCSQENIAGCGADADGNGDPMDANFNYPGTKYISTDTKVNVFDYAVWIQGFITENPPLATPTKLVTTPSVSITISPSVVPTITPPLGAVQGIWISKEEVKLRQPSGDEWNIILKTAEKAATNAARISDQDSNHDIDTLAMALVCINLGRADMCTKARAAVVSAINTEEGGRWLAVGRNLGSYIIAADLLNLYPDNDPSSQGSKVGAWLAKMYTRTLPSNNDPKILHTFRQSAWNSASNASAQEGFAYTALSTYLKKTDGLEWSWNAYRRYVGDRTSTHYLTASDMTWQLYPSPANPGAPADKDDPVGIQDAGSAKNGCRLDGALSNDMARGAAFSCTPAFTQYPWVGLEGAVPAAVIFQRAGYPAFTVANNALLRAFEYLWEIRQKTGKSDWFNGTRSNEIIHLVNIAYKKSFILNKPVSGGGRTVDFTLWTHPSGL